MKITIHEAGKRTDTPHLITEVQGMVAADQVWPTIVQHGVGSDGNKYLHVITLFPEDIDSLRKALDLLEEMPHSKAVGKPLCRVDEPAEPEPSKCIVCGGSGEDCPQWCSDFRAGKAAS